MSEKKRKKVEKSSKVSDKKDDIYNRMRNETNKKGTSMNTTYCEKHNLPSYETENGPVHTCSVCHPEIIEKVENHKRMINHGALWVNDEMCDEFTLEWLKEYAKITATVPNHAADCFFNDCVDCGVDVDYGENNVMTVYKSSAKSRSDKRWYSTEVSFPADKDLVLPGLNVRHKGNKLVVSNNEFTGWLLSKISNN
jgi:hypothetical protein